MKKAPQHRKYNSTCFLGVGLSEEDVQRRCFGKETTLVYASFNGKNISICKIIVEFGRLINIKTPYNFFHGKIGGSPENVHALTRKEGFLLYPTFLRELRDCAKKSAKKYGPIAPFTETLGRYNNTRNENHKTIRFGQGVTPKASTRHQCEAMTKFVQKRCHHPRKNPLCCSIRI